MPWQNRPEKPLTEQQRNRRLVISLVSRLVILFMLAIGIVYLIISVITGSSLTVPKTATGVLKGAESPNQYSWLSESVRLANLGGGRQRQDSVRQATINLKENRYWAVAAGALPERTFYASDGKLMLRVTDTRIDSNLDWERWSNICQNDPPVRAATLAMPTAQYISKLDPDIVTDKATFLGQRAWMISFKPSPQFLSQMMGIPFYLASEDYESNRWVLSSKERAALRAGKYKVDTARAWVIRSEPRQLTQIQVRFKFTIPGGSSWQLLGRRLRDDNLKARPLDKLVFPKPCPPTDGSSDTTVSPGEAEKQSNGDLIVGN